MLNSEPEESADGEAASREMPVQFPRLVELLYLLCTMTRGPIYTVFPRYSRFLKTAHNGGAIWSNGRLNSRSLKFTNNLRNARAG